MFSGIVEEKGTVKKVLRKQNLSVITVRANKTAKDTKKGGSICVDGVCLTVTKKEKNEFTFDVMLETLKKTTLGMACVGGKLNLERSLKVDDRICGHFVSGHVDSMAEVKDIVLMENYVEIVVAIPEGQGIYIVPKGSVCINGVSLTVGDVRKDSFSVYLIPFTLDVTNLGLVKKGDKVNIETDILAKYLYKQTQEAKSPYSYSKK
ncbi:MAG: riboflavin synthase [Candidatus Omnitrophica bacterium]|nr:riboflavin synthase [Candidatus Omnitrophota bacterium]